MLPVLLALLALLLLLLARRARRQAGLPAGIVVYTDTGGWARAEAPLFSARLGLTGKRADSPGDAPNAAADVAGN